MLRKKIFKILIKTVNLNTLSIGHIEDCHYMFSVQENNSIKYQKLVHEHVHISLRCFFQQKKDLLTFKMFVKSNVYSEERKRVHQMINISIKNY